MKPALFHQDAQSELDDAIAFYEAHRDGLGLDLQSRVESAVKTIQKAPRRWPVYKSSQFRQRPIKRFPYTIYYMDLEDHVWIVAIAHQKRRPGYWTRRNHE